MQPTKEVDVMEADQSAKDTSDKFVPDEIAQLFRLFEMSIRIGGNPIYYRVITSKITDKILAMEKAGLFFVVLHLMESMDSDSADINEEMIEAWCIIISFFADNLQAENAPNDSDMPGDWFLWAADFVGITIGEEVGDEATAAE